MDTMHKIAECFSRFPGVGPRQARRFVYFLLSNNPRFSEELAKMILGLKNAATTCTSCFRFFNPGASETLLCETCRNPARDSETLMVIHRDADFENVERSGAYIGRYFVLGGTVPVLEKDPERRVRMRELCAHIEKHAKNRALKEIILAFAVNADGESTRECVAAQLRPLVQKYNITLSTLGRGLSTGIELEYPDGETIRHALAGRQ